jgi:glucokinase
MNDHYAIGIDIGGTRTKIGLVRADPAIPGWELIAHCTIPSNLKTPDPAPFLESASQVVEGYFEQHPVEGIGIALCSLINRQRTGASISVNAPALNNLNLKHIFASRFGCPVKIINDVNAYALAEFHYGAGRGVERLLCLALGTGMSIAAIAEGNVIETWAGVSADAGRIVLDPHSEARCAGGVVGSAEALIGTAAIRRLAQEAYQNDVPARQVIAACAAGADPIAIRIMQGIGSHAGHLLALLSPVFFPQKIIVTGGTAEAGEPFLRAIRDRYRSMIGEYMLHLSSLDGSSPTPVEIVKGELGPEASILGSVFEFLNS